LTALNIKEKSLFLISTLTSKKFPFDRITELTDDGESLEVFIPGIQDAKIKEGDHIWQRFSDFLPFSEMDENLHLGEGNTALIRADRKLQEFTGIKNLFLKNETQNPTWSFKDRGSLAVIYMAKLMGEKVTATISSGNMGHSVAAYGAKGGIKVIVFVPEFVPDEKIQPMLLHNAHVIKVEADDYSVMKMQILHLAEKLHLRIVSGNGPIRVEGYKLTAFEMFEQLKHEVPDYIAVPTSACGHIRGIFKGYRELYQAGIIKKLPKMITIQAENNSPIVTAIKQGKDHIVPFTNFHTIAEAITSGNPMGGDEIIQKTKEYHWLSESVTEKEILLAQQKFGEAGYFVEPASSTVLYAVKKLYKTKKIEENARVVLVLTGTGLKDLSVFSHYHYKILKSDLGNIETDLESIISK
jgi:threonine synthase